MPLGAAPAPHKERGDGQSPEVRMPQPVKEGTRKVQLNKRLEKLMHWSLLCNVLSAMRIRLRAAITRVKEVREFPSDDLVAA